MIIKFDQKRNGERSLMKSVKFIIIMLMFLAQNAHAEIKTGWFTSLEKPEYLDAHYKEGSTLLVTDACGWYATWRGGGWEVVKNYLDKAHSLGFKIIMDMNRERQTPYGIPVNDFVDFVNYFKTHPAVFGWYIGDEPELYKGGWEMPYSYLKTNVGYYRLLKENTNQPAFVTHDQSNERYHLSSKFFDVTDISGLHAYPFWKNQAEFYNADSRRIYDQWKKLFSDAKAAGKDFIATAQGFGDGYGSNSINRNPTYNELRYGVFSAIGLGINKVLFWHYHFSNDPLRTLVAKIINDISLIKKEMGNGITNDPAIKVSQNLIADDKLLIRYGKSGNNHVILAVNIANRGSSNGLILSKVKFTLPPEISASRIEVVREGRELKAQAGMFEDDFERFQVHIYRISAASALKSPSGLKVVAKP
jgi:hypothetical protein